VFHDLTPLHRSEQMRADFVANASHELRTPLATLSGFIETLHDAPARARFLSIMHVQARRMTRLIDDLLSLSHIDLTEHVRPRDSVEVGGVIRQLVDALQPLATDRAVELHTALPDTRVLVRGDRDELLRVFENLVENALKYGASGKRVDIALLLLHHSDQGSQYTSEQFQRLLTANGVTCSMSRSGNVLDNAAMESFFSSLKTERTGRKLYRTRNEAKADVFDYIERFYNPKRRRSTIGYLSPVEFERSLTEYHPNRVQATTGDISSFSNTFILFGSPEVCLAL
jgi:light-regulated signal transduction histidine kinase (bacteriophytochrome)